jgi:hypothetical protein
MVHACRRVAVLLERARRQAALGRPRAAIDAVEEARACLSAPLGSLIRGAGGAGILAGLGGTAGPPGAGGGAAAAAGGATMDGQQPPPGGAAVAPSSAAGVAAVLRLEDTPFGLRAMQMLTMIENVVLMGARRGLNRWFLALRSGGDAAKSGRAALRRCASSVSTSRA